MVGSTIYATTIAITSCQVFFSIRCHSVVRLIYIGVTFSERHRLAYLVDV